MNKSCFFWSDPEAIEEVADILKKGNVVIGTSDTVLGLLAQVSCDAVEALNRIKGRSSKPYIILIKSQKMVRNFSDCNISGACQLLMESCWPGPLTIVVRARADVARSLTGADGTIALRVPKHEGLQALLNHVPAILSTSANKSGVRVPCSVSDLESSIIDSASAIITDDHQGCVDKASKPSTVIDCTGPEIRLIREGAFGVDMLEDISGQKIAR